MIVHSRVARHVSVVLGYFYPALASAKVVVQQDPTAFTQWMTYWVVMSVFAMVEILVDFFVSWVPLYFEAKIVLIVWLAMPKYQGASQIYRRLLHPYLDMYEGDIDNSLEEMKAGATRRIQSFGASAATEIAKAVTKQGSTAKELMLARVLGMAAAGGANPREERPIRSAPPSPTPRRVYESEERPRDAPLEEEVEEVPAANASMLMDFVEVMKGGVTLQARCSFAAQDGDCAWRTLHVRMVNGTTWCITEPDRVEGEGDVPARGRAGVDGARGEHQFEVLAAEALEDDASGLSLLVLKTDKGVVELSPPGPDDRDSMLVGFELLIAASSDRRDAGDDRGSIHEVEGESSTGVRGRNVARRKSRRWEGAKSAGPQDMMLESSNDDSSDADDRQHHHQR